MVFVWRKGLTLTLPGLGLSVGLQLFFPLLKLWYMIHFGVLISSQKENNTVEGCEVCVYVGLKLYISSPYKVEHMGPACVKVES